MNAAQLLDAPARRSVSLADWYAEGVRLFGSDHGQWRFVCPACGFVTSVDTWRRMGAGQGEIAFSCVGRHIDGSRKAFASDMTAPGPCDYAGGGLLQIHPVTILLPGDRQRRCFEFAGRTT